MDYKTLDVNIHVNTELGYTIRYVKSDTEYFSLHNHSYFEVFLMCSGNAKHFVNGKIQNLSEGDLLFIRDYDIHDYAGKGDCKFDFLNISFEEESLYDLFSYLGEGFLSKPLLEATYPPCVSLLKREKEKLFYAMMELNTNMSGDIGRTKMRILLLNIFTSYFQNYSETETDIPLWLEITYDKMKRPSNFIAGASRMVEISGRSREHLSRLMKQHYQITPTELITELRLNHAVNLMRNSNLSITDICFECGFSNLSWFYKIFERKYNARPAQYKKNLNIK